MKKRNDSLQVKCIYKNMTNKQQNIVEYIFIFVIVLITFILCRSLGIKNDELKTQTLMIAALAGTSGYALYLSAGNRLTAEKIMQCVIIGGIIMRVGYMIYTHMFIRGNDLGEFSSKIYENGTGHLGYIYYIAENGKLPDSNLYQLYHPPLYHILSAITVRIAGIFLKPGDMQGAFEFVQIINCTVACIMLPILRDFFNEIEIDKKYAPWAMAIVAFLPCFYQMGGRLNNDMLVVFFMLLCIIYTYRWYKKRNMKTIVCLALCFGFGMMSKISCGTMAFFTGLVMLYVLYKDFRAKAAGQTVRQLIVFAAICVPLALWYPIRNYIMFKQPLNYVLELGTNSFVYRGNIPWYQRMFEFSLSEMISHPFADAAHDNSVLMYALRTAMFGEAEFIDRQFAASILNVINFMLVVASFVSMIYVMIKNKTINLKYKYGLALVWTIMFGAFIQFNFAFPYICTANFRYMPLTTVIGAVYIIYAMQTTERKYISAAVKILIFSWCVFGSIVYI